MTTTPAAPPLLPVTPEDREAAWPHRPDCYRHMDQQETRQNWDTGIYDHLPLLQAFARYRQAHSLPGDVGMLLADLESEARRFAGFYEPNSDMANTLNIFGNKIAALAAALTPSATISDATKRMEKILGATFQATPSAPEPVQKLHELPPGEHLCRHCEGKDSHCSVCEGVGSLPSALSGEDGSRIIRFSDEKGDFVVGEDGCTIFWPEGIARGGFNAWHLRALADELDRRNADWLAQMRADRAAHQGAGE